MAGSYTEGVTPDPIPNSVVKPLRADGSNPARDCESRSLPAFIFDGYGSSIRAAVFLFYGRGLRLGWDSRQRADFPGV